MHLGEYVSNARGSACTLASHTMLRFFVALQPWSAAAGALVSSPVTQRLGRRVGLLIGG